jgi:copper(I)-binding protein
MTAMATPALDGGGLTAPSGKSGLFAIVLVAGLMPGFAVAGDALQVSNARVPASNEIGTDLPLVMTIRNDASEADAILRVRCPFANFHEKHTVDRGEGAPAMRAIKSIPIPENKTIELKRDAYHVIAAADAAEAGRRRDVHLRHRFPEGRNQGNGGADFRSALIATVDHRVR